MARLPADMRGAIRAMIDARPAYVLCATPRCTGILTQRLIGWQGDPEWTICRKCGSVNRIAADGVRIVNQVGDER